MSFDRSFVSARAPLGALAISLAVAGTAGTVCAAPQADLEHLILSETALAMGDCGSVVAQQSAGAAEYDATQALERAAQVLAVTGEYTAFVAQGLRHLCEAEGLSTCESAARCEAMTEDFQRAGQMIADRDLKTAAILVASAADAYRDVFSFETNGAISDALRLSFTASANSLDAASAMLSVLASPGAFNEATAYPLEVYASGIEAMLAELRVPAEYGWPSGFLQVEHYVGGNFDGKWDAGTQLASQLERPEAKLILNGWSQLGPQGVLDAFGGAAVLQSLHGFGSGMRDCMYGLRADLMKGLVVDGWCDLECQNDQNCGGCRIREVGIGLAYHNPDEVKDARLVVDLLLEIDVTRRGVSLTPDALRNAVSDAFGDLIDKLLARSGYLYIHMERNRCVFSRCFIFWEESDCTVAKKEWVKVPLPVVQQLTPTRLWSAGEWRTAAKAAQRAAADWCRLNP